MKEIRLAYSDLYNAGDLMNIDIVEKLGNCKVVWSRSFNAEIMAIGGALVGLQYPDDTLRRLCYKGIHRFYGKKPIYIWGSGFLHDYNSNKLYRDDLHVCALRGIKTQQKLFGLTGVYYDVPLADGGLLIDRLFQKKETSIKYKIGLIPHMSQQEESAVKKMANMKGVHFIDIKQTPQAVAQEISLCEAIASSSLHGLVFADALHIPNIHILGKTDLRGRNFKFEDYYSAFGLDDRPFLLEDHIPDFDEILSSYKIPADMVEQKKQELLDCFPRF